jgi:hypothetical protein
MVPLPLRGEGRERVTKVMAEELTNLSIGLRKRSMDVDILMNTREVRKAIRNRLN